MENTAQDFFGLGLVWSLWAMGFVLYLFIITVLIRRLFSGGFRAEDWEASYWICMGAPAIITLAGSEFVIHLSIPLGEEFSQVTLGMSLFAWTIATLWIPYLIVMDIRKLSQAPGAVPLWIKIFPWSRLGFGGKYHSYDPPSWGRVFPMGMYTACTLFLAEAADYPFLESISSCWAWFALLIWSLTLIGASRSLGKLLSNWQM